MASYFFHYMIRIPIQLSLYDTLHNNKTRGVFPCVSLVSSEVCAADIGRTHVFVSAILNITLNTTQHGFFSSVCSENCRA